MQSPYMTGAKRIVAVGTTSTRGARAHDRPAGVAHAVSREPRKGSVSLCGTPVTGLPHHDWSDITVGVLRCRECESLATAPLEDSAAV